MYSTDEGGVVLDGNFFFGSRVARIDRIGQTTFEDWSLNGDYREVEYGGDETWYGFQSSDFALAAIDSVPISGALASWSNTRGSFQKRASVPALRLSCKKVVRGSVTSCTVSSPTSQQPIVKQWQFKDSQGNRVISLKESNIWSGIAVKTGTVAAVVLLADGQTFQLLAQLRLLARDWHTQPPPPN